MLSRFCAKTLETEILKYSVLTYGEVNNIKRTNMKKKYTEKQI